MKKPHPNLFDLVREKLTPYRGEELTKLAETLKMSYDTLLRIRDGKTDPVWSNLVRIAEHFKLGTR